MAKYIKSIPKYSDEFIKEVMLFKQTNTYRATSEKFNISIGTLKTWKHKNRLNVPRGKQGVKGNLEEKYEILKKFIDFLNQQKDKE